MTDIKLSIQSKKQEVIQFLDDLKVILNDKNFEVTKDFRLVRKKKSKEQELFSTPYTMVDLNYDVSDVVDRLKELTISEYVETLIDKDDIAPPLLFVFGKAIRNKQVYIKLKIKKEPTRRVLCVSFHYAKERMVFPYA